MHNEGESGLPAGRTTPAARTAEFTLCGRAFGHRASVHIECRLRHGDSRQRHAQQSAGRLAYVQAVRWTYTKHGTFLVPAHYCFERAVAGHRNRYLNGWMVDRPAGRIWGHYGRRNDGSFDPACVKLGDGPTPAGLFDSPGVPRGDMEFAAIAAVIGVDAASGLGHEYLGHYRWSFRVTGNGRGLGLVHGEATPHDRKAFDAAVAKWNLVSGILGTRLLPQCAGDSSR